MASGNVTNVNIKSWRDNDIIYGADYVQDIEQGNKYTNTSGLLFTVTANTLTLKSNSRIHIQDHPIKIASDITLSLPLTLTAGTVYFFIVHNFDTKTYDFEWDTDSSVGSSYGRYRMELCRYDHAGGNVNLGTSNTSNNLYIFCTTAVAQFKIPLKQYNSVRTVPIEELSMRSELDAYLSDGSQKKGEYYESNVRPLRINSGENDAVLDIHSSSTTASAYDRIVGINMRENAVYKSRIVFLRDRQTGEWYASYGRPSNSKLYQAELALIQDIQNADGSSKYALNGAYSKVETVYNLPEGTNNGQVYNIPFNMNDYKRVKITYKCFTTAGQTPLFEGEISSTFDWISSNVLAYRDIDVNLEKYEADNDIFMAAVTIKMSHNQFVMTSSVIQRTAASAVGQPLVVVGRTSLQIIRIDGIKDN